METFNIITTIFLIGIGLWQVKIMKGQVAKGTEALPKISWQRRYWPILVMFLIVLLNWIPYFLQPQFKRIPHDQRQLVEGKQFVNETIEIDGKLFHQCDFWNTKLLYHGRAGTSFEYTRFHGTIVLITDNPPSQAMMQLVVGLLSMGNLTDAQRVGFDDKGNLILVGPPQAAPSH